MSTMISAVKKTDYAHEFFERMRSSNPNHIIKEQVQRIEDAAARRVATSQRREHHALLEPVADEERRHPVHAGCMSEGGDRGVVA